MDCRTAEMLISLQPDDQLTIEENAWLAVHIANCRACASEQQLQERLSRTLEDIGRFELEAPAELGSLVMNKLRSQRRSLLTYIPATWRKAMAAAAALLLIAGSSAGITGFLKMAGGGKTVGLETTPTILSDGGSGYMAPGGSTGQSAPDSAALSQGEGISGGTPDNEPNTQGTEGAFKDATPTAVAPDKSTSPSRIAGGETALLSSGMKVTSTVLKFAVNDLASARAKAVSIAAGFGATNQIFPEQSSGRQILVMRLTIRSDQAPGLISNLGQVGSVVDRQDEIRDLTPLYNETLVEYDDLLARQSTVQDPEEQRKLEVQAASYKQQLDAWAEEAGKRVIMVWLEGE